MFSADELKQAGVFESCKAVDTVSQALIKPMQKVISNDYRFPELVQGMVRPDLSVSEVLKLKLNRIKSRENRNNK